MIFSLAQDLQDTVAAMPREHPKQRMLELLEEVNRREIHFIDRHPTTLFQCMWNGANVVCAMGNVPAGGLPKLREDVARLDSAGDVSECLSDRLWWSESILGGVL